jgi:hypothetical protein
MWNPHLRNGGVAGNGQTVKVIRGQDTLLGDQHGILVRNFFDGFLCNKNIEHFRLFLQNINSS